MTHRKRFKTGTEYVVSTGDRFVKITYCGRFAGLKRNGVAGEKFLVFRLEPPRFARPRKKPTARN